MVFEVYECKKCKQTLYKSDVFVVHLSGNINTIKILEYYCKECFAKGGKHD